MSGVYLSGAVRFKEHRFKVGHVRSIFLASVRFKEHGIKVGHVRSIFFSIS